MSVFRRDDRSNEWWIDVRVRGRRFRRRATSQVRADAAREAVAFRAQLERDEREGSRQIFDGRLLNPDMTLAEFVPFWVEHYVAVANRPSTQREKTSVLRSCILPAFGHRKLKDMTTVMIDAQFTLWKRNKRFEGKRANNVATILRRLLNSAAEWGVIPAAPKVSSQKYLPPVPVALRIEEARRLLEAMPEGRMRLFALLMLRTGLRIGEASALKWSDLRLDVREPFITVQRSYGIESGVCDTKTDSSRRAVPISNELKRALFEYREVAPRDSEFIFISSGGKLPTSNGTLHILHQACKRAGIPEVSWHKLRHTFATSLMTNQVPIGAVKVMMGHRSALTTLRYQHVFPEHQREYVMRLDG